MKIKYIGKGSSIPNVPARDMSEAEFEALSGDLKAAALASGLYEIEKLEKPKPRKAEAKELHNDESWS